MIQRRIAVVIGSQGRCLNDPQPEYNSIKEIDAFLSLFNIDYDIYVFTDSEYEKDFIKLKNIKDIRLSENTLMSDRICDHFSNRNPTIKENKNLKSGPLWGHYKASHAAEMVHQSGCQKYSHVLKIRTDFTVDYIQLLNHFNREFAESKKITPSNFSYNDYLNLKNIFYGHILNSDAVPPRMKDHRSWKPTIYRAGDRFMLGPSRPVLDVLTSFQRPWEFEEMQYTYNPQRVRIRPITHDGLDHTLWMWTYPDYIGHDIDFNNTNLLEELKQSISKNWDRLSSESTLPPDRCFSFHGGHGISKKWDGWRTPTNPDRSPRFSPDSFMNYVDGPYVDPLIYSKTSCNMYGLGMFKPGIINLRLSNEHAGRSFCSLDPQDYKELLANNYTIVKKILSYNENT